MSPNASAETVRGQISGHCRPRRALGSERISRRDRAGAIEQHVKAVDVANGTDPAHYLDWKKRRTGLRRMLPEISRSRFPARSVRSGRNVCDLRAPGSRSSVSTTDLVSPRDAPKATRTCSIRSGRARSSRPSRLQRRHHDRDVRARARSRMAVSRKTLRSRRVMQVQSAQRIHRRRYCSGSAPSWPTATTDDLLLLEEVRAGRSRRYSQPRVHPLIIVPSGVFRAAPNPNAARLFQSFFFSPDPADAGRRLCAASRSAPR